MTLSVRYRKNDESFNLYCGEFTRDIKLFRLRAPPRNQRRDGIVLKQNILVVLFTNPIKNTVLKQKNQSTLILQQIKFILFIHALLSRKRLGHKCNRCRESVANVCARFTYSPIAPVTTKPQTRRMRLRIRPSC